MQESSEKRIRQGENDSRKKSRIQEANPTAYFLLRQARLGSTRILPKDKLFFQARILHRRHKRRILTDNQEKQESGKNDVEIVN